MRICGCAKVWAKYSHLSFINNRRACADCGHEWHSMPRMHKGKYISPNLIVKVNEQGHINTIKIDGNRIHASINYEGVL